MALNQATLKKLIVDNLKNAGFDTDNEFSKTTVFAQAIADAVVTHIKTAEVQVTVTGGSSAGVVTGVIQ